MARGGYVLADPNDGDAELIFVASGSEVHIAYQAHLALAADGIPTRVVSMPSWELFEEQDSAYRDEVLPPSVRKRLAIEAGSPLGWERYVGDNGEIVGMDGFGASAPQAKLAEAFGFTAEDVVRRAHLLLETVSPSTP